jgi:hypothetical protein
MGSSAGRPGQGLSHATPPVMSLGVRATAEQTVHSGFRNILYHAVKEEEASAVDAYLRTLEPGPSPGVASGHLKEIMTSNFGQRSLW